MTYDFKLDNLTRKRRKVMKVVIRLLSLARLAIDCFVAKELLVSCLRATGYRMMQAPRFQLRERKLCRT